MHGEKESGTQSLAVAQAADRSDVENGAICTASSSLPSPGLESFQQQPWFSNTKLGRTGQRGRTTSLTQFGSRSGFTFVALDGYIIFMLYGCNCQTEKINYSITFFFNLEKQKNPTNKTPKTKQKRNHTKPGSRVQTCLKQINYIGKVRRQGAELKSWQISLLG